MSQLIGHRELKKALRKNEQEAKRKMRLAAQAGGKEIEADASNKVPVLTGNLKRSIHTEVEDEGDNVNALIGTDVEYAPFVEYGTSKMNAQPYLRPAFDAKKTRALQIMQLTLRKLKL